MQYVYPRLKRYIGAAALLAGLLTGVAHPARAQWVTQNTNFPAVSTGAGQVEVVNPSVVWATAVDGSGLRALYNNFSRTTDGGATWTPGIVTPAAGLGWCNLSARSASLAWAAMIDPNVGGGQIYRTTNGGTTWTRQAAAAFPIATGGFVDGIIMLSAATGVMFGDPLSTTNEFEIYTTTNGGGTWTPVPGANIADPDVMEYGYIGVFATDGGGQNVWFGTNQGSIYYSTNAGTTWAKTFTGLTQVNNIAFSSATDGLAMQVTNTGALAQMVRTTDGGLTWNPVTVVGTVRTSDMKAVPGAIGTYISAGANGGNGSSVTTDGGLTWEDLEIGVPRTAIGAADASNIWAGAFTNTTGMGGMKYNTNLTPIPPAGNTAPDWTWARQIAANQYNDASRGVAIDATGNIYVTGFFTGQATFGTTSILSTGDVNCYLVKYNPQGVFQWVQQFGGALDDFGRDVTVDAAGNIYVAGLMRGTATFGPGVTATARGDADAFVAKFSATGQALWARAGGSADFDVAYQVAVDAAGNVYTSGAFGGPGGPDALFGTTSLTSAGGSDAYVASYTSAGVLRWAKRGGGTGDEFAFGMAVTSAGDVAICGNFSNTATFGTTTLTSAGGTDGFMARYSNTGTALSAQRVGGATNEDANSIATDTNGNLYLTGDFGGSLTFAGTTVISGGSFSFFAVSYAANGTERWVQAGGGSGASGLQVTTDVFGNAYVAGYYQGAAQFGIHSLTNNGSADLVVLKLVSATGEVQWAQSANGDGNDIGRGIAVDAGGNIYVAGSTESLVFTFEPTIIFNGGGIGGGLVNGFIAKIANVCTLTAPTAATSGPACIGGSLTLTATGVPTSGVSVRWTGPNGFVANTNPATVAGVSAASVGTYTVVVTSLTTQGCSVRATVAATVGAPAAPTTTAASRCGPGTLDLMAAGTPTGGAYAWYTVATGGTAIGGATTATYTTPSLNATTTYYVSVVTGGTCESARVAATATVRALPAAALAAAGSITFCQGGSVTFTASGAGAGGTYQFQRNGANIVGTTGTTYAATQAGSYTVTAMNAAGCAATSAAQVVTVTPPATVAFAYAAGTFCLSGTNPVPAITGATGGTFLSTAGLSLNATTGAINLAASTAGTYVVTYTAGAPCPASQTQTVTVTTAPQAGFSYAAAMYCAGAAGQVTPALTAGASAGTFAATPAGLSISATSGVVDIAASQAGTYVITNDIAASGSCAAATATGTLMIAATPTAAVAAGGPVMFCAGDSVTLTATGGDTYRWSTGATTPTLTVRAAGTYYVLATNAAGCADTSQTLTVSVNALPTPTLAAGGPTTFCEGDSVILTATGGATYRWSTGATTPTLKVRTTGAYYVLATNAAGCTDTSARLAVTVTPTPARPTITRLVQGTVLLTSSAPTGNQWYRNTVLIPGATAQTYLVTAAAFSGIYTVMTTTNGCPSPLSSRVAATVMGVPAALAATALHLYPNPVTAGSLTVALTGTPSAVGLTLLDALGRPVVTGTAQPDVRGASTTLLDVRGLAAGVYVLRLSSPDGSRLTRRVTIE